MLQIYLIRHGQTEWNTLHKMQGTMNSNLTTQGKQQAISLGNYMEDKKFDQIYVSTATRAVETASYIFKDSHKDYSKDLSEIAMGEWEGMTYEEIKEKYPDKWNQFFNDPFAYEPSKGGETYEQLESRLKSFVEKEGILKKNGVIAIVSHRITIRMLLSVLMKDRSLFSKIDLDPTSVSIVEVENEQCVISKINDTSHYV